MTVSLWFARHLDDVRDSECYVISKALCLISMAPMALIGILGQFIAADSQTSQWTTISMGAERVRCKCFEDGVE
ncbi:MAG: hypothetical protein C7B46_02655 [Sulfobacillus benefaciens]|uniref:Uncharacterized protein n=1 Tax=Sulfobacillus benefaciens TaxID=453960 RepID=A0A2T2XKP7_9FIRM|nr:MAG: hypothetical protein C7B46_02655 [Sulfobacillus benefaciens]